MGVCAEGYLGCICKRKERSGTIMTNLRELAGFKSYGDVVREERFFCAVLFHLLLSDERALQAFLEMCGVKTDGLDLRKVRVYVEYAMARDLWDSLGKSKESNERKKQFIMSKVNPIPTSIVDLNIEKFNKKFVAGRISPEYIQSPGRWGIGRICGSLENPEVVRKACKLKWAFNIKPDIVIELNTDTVVCVEAKMESGEGQYPSSAERKILKERNLTDVCRTQREIQAFLMTDILGFSDVHRVFLSNGRQEEGKDESEVALTWADVFGRITGITAIMVELARKRSVELAGKRK